jgi:hypothetical protein
LCVTGEDKVARFDLIVAGEAGLHERLVGRFAPPWGSWVPPWASRAPRAVLRAGDPGDLGGEDHDQGDEDSDLDHRLSRHGKPLRSVASHCSPVVVISSTALANPNRGREGW